MNVTVSDVYHWQRPELEQRCSEWQLSAEGSVGELRKRLTAYDRSRLVAEMDKELDGVETGRVEVGAIAQTAGVGQRDTNTRGVKKIIQSEK